MLQPIRKVLIHRKQMNQHRMTAVADHRTKMNCCHHCCCSNHFANVPMNFFVEQHQPLMEDSSMEKDLLLVLELNKMVDRCVCHRNLFPHRHQIWLQDMVYQEAVRSILHG